MTKEERKEELENAFAEFAAEYPQTALATIIGLFVGLLTFSVREQGGDPEQTIQIDGMGERDITVHALKGE